MNIEAMKTTKGNKLVLLSGVYLESYIIERKVISVNEIPGTIYAIFLVGVRQIIPLSEALQADSFIKP